MHVYKTPKSHKKSGIIWSFIYIHKTFVKYILTAYYVSLPDPILISLDQCITCKTPVLQVFTFQKGDMEINCKHNMKNEGKDKSSCTV